MQGKVVVEGSAQPALCVERLCQTVKSVGVQKKVVMLGINRAKEISRRKRGVVRENTEEGLASAMYSQRCRAIM